MYAARVLATGAFGRRQQERGIGAACGERRSVRFYVFREMVRAHEGLVANLAIEFLFASVDSHVPVQFIGASELL